MEGAATERSDGDARTATDSRGDGRAASERRRDARAATESSDGEWKSRDGNWRRWRKPGTEGCGGDGGSCSMEGCGGDRKELLDGVN